MKRLIILAVLGLAFFVSNGYSQIDPNVFLCLSGKIKCDPSIIPTVPGGCKLPEYPLNGGYSIKLGFLKGRSLNYLSYYCDRDYTLDTYKNSYCVRGNWTINPMCLNNCLRLVSPTVDFDCYHNGKYDSDRQPCNVSQPVGTVAKPRCKPGHTRRRPAPDMLCDGAGRWNHDEPHCLPDCGRDLPKSFVSGSVAGEVPRSFPPWHVGVYRAEQEGTVPRYTCGGTLVSEMFVITAAHCFYDDAREKLYPESEYKVAVGKIYKDWNHIEERTGKYVHKSEISSIVVPERFEGLRMKRASDLAVLLLSSPVAYSQFVYPVCLDIDDSNFDSEQLAEGQIGKTSGWFFTPSDLLLKEVSLPFVEYTRCRDATRTPLRIYISSDKFCGGNQEGASICHGDSGSGLVFRYVDNFGTARWYLRGVAGKWPVKGEFIDPEEEQESFVKEQNAAENSTKIDYHKQGNNDSTGSYEWQFPDTSDEADSSNNVTVVPGSSNRETISSKNSGIKVLSLHKNLNSQGNSNRNETKPITSDGHFQRNSPIGRGLNESVRISGWDNLEIDTGSRRDDVNLESIERELVIPTTSRYNTRGAARRNQDTIKSRNTRNAQVSRKVAKLESHDYGFIVNSLESGSLNFVGGRHTRGIQKSQSLNLSNARRGAESARYVLRDSDGGIVFLPEDGASKTPVVETRFASNADEAGNNNCRKGYSIFTSVYFYSSFINEIFKRYQ